MKRITINPGRSLRKQITDEATRSARRPKLVAKAILENALENRARYTGDLTGQWGKLDASSFTIDLGDDKKAALKSWARQRELPLNAFVIYLLRRHYEISG